MRGEEYFALSEPLEPAALSEIDVITGGDSTQSIGRPHTAALSRHVDTCSNRYYCSLPTGKDGNNK